MAFLWLTLKQQIARELSVVKIVQRKRKLEVLKWQPADYSCTAKYCRITGLVVVLIFLILKKVVIKVVAVMKSPLGLVV